MCQLSVVCGTLDHEKNQLHRGAHLSVWCICDESLIFKVTPFHWLYHSLVFHVPQDLKDFMRQAGEVTYADAHKQRKNEGVVEFANFSDMKNALEKLQDQEFSGRKIHLVEDKRKSGGNRKLSKSRSRSRTKFRRSRSGSSRRSSRSKSRTPSKGRSPKSKNGSRSRSRSLSDDSGRENNHNDRSISRSPKRDDKD